MLKRIGLLLPVVICTLLGGLHAADFAALKPQGYVSDFAEVVDQTTRDQVNQYCANVERITGAQLALVTLKSTEGEPVEDVANLLYRQWGVGNKKTNEGALILFVINDRRTRIEVGYGLEPIMTDGYVGGLLRSLRPSLRTGSYAQALADAATQIGEKIAASKGVSLGTAAPRRATRPHAEGLPVGADCHSRNHLHSVSDFARTRRFGLWRRHWRLPHRPFDRQHPGRRRAAQPWGRGIRRSGLRRQLRRIRRRRLRWRWGFQ